MYAECLPFAQIPHTARLFADFLYDFPRVSPFFAAPPDLRSWTEAQLRRPDYDAGRRERVAAVLARQNRAWNAGPAALSAIERLRQGAVAVVTGQQIGLFGGPTYTLYKALTAAKVAVELTNRGISAVPIFWLATEDHDFQEIRSVTIPSAPGELVSLAATSSAPPDAPVGARPLESDITSAIQALRATLGDAEAVEWVAECYRPGATWGDAFARLLARAFSRFGLIVVDPADAELHQLAVPVFERVVAESDVLNAALLARGKELDRAGYHEQVKVTAATSLLFMLRGGARLPVRRNGSGFVAGDEKLPADELRRRVVAEPQAFSANALLRPALQDYLLPTAAYVGGPAEVAYFAQAGVIYERLLGRITPVLPRLSVTLVEPRAARLLDRYRLALPDLFHGAEAARVTLSSRNLPAELETSFGGAAAAIGEHFRALQQQLQQLDPTLVRAAERAGGKMNHQLERLRARAARAQLRREAELARHADRLSTALYPHKGLQERTVGSIYWLARYGSDLLASLAEQLPLTCPDHQIVRL